MTDVIADPNTYYRIVLGLSIVIVLFLFVSKYLKKYPNFISTGRGELFNIVKKQNFDSQTCFYLMDSCGKYYLLMKVDGKLEKIDSFEKDQLELFDHLNLKKLSVSDLKKEDELI
ncbi:hypothetical protein MJH12_13815 [bacterium]|nr:hypothetical protein [bacterium]